MKLLAFDCDGTILDTRMDYQAALNNTLNEYGLQGITLDQVTAFLGYGTDHLVRETLKASKAPDGIYEEFKKNYLNRYFSNLFVHTREYPGITEFLERAQSLEYLLAVISNKPDQAVKKLISESFPTIRFKAVKGQGEGERPKPYPDLLLSVLKDLDISTSDTAYYGDTEVDALLARNASVKYLYICRWGFRPKEELDEALKKENIVPTMVLDAPQELYRTLE